MVKYRSVQLDNAARELRSHVREIIAGLPTEVDEPMYSRAVSQALGEAGLVGLSVPSEYGGQQRSAVERFIVVEELLAHNVPIHAHYIADRQAAPMILRHGTEMQRRKILPALCRGEVGFSIGLSEPQAGSDLANIEMRATQDGDGWLLSGRKIWTSFAHRNRYVTLLARTAPRGDDRHAGLSQFIVDLRTPGIEIQPIRTLDGNAHFCEVLFDDVWVDADSLLGSRGAGWRQVMDELSYERSGPDRYFSSFRLLSEFIAWRKEATRSDEHDRVIGDLCARFVGVRLMSLSVAHDLDDAGAPLIESALVKDVGTDLEREIVERLAQVCEGRLDLSPGLAAELDAMLLMAPSFTLRGGSSAVLRSLAARSITPGSFDAWGAEDEERMLIESIEGIVEQARESWAIADLDAAERWDHASWQALLDAGFSAIDSVVGGDDDQTGAAAAAGVAVGRAALSLPLLENGPLANWLAHVAGIELPSGLTGVAIGELEKAHAAPRGKVGTASAVPWGRRLDQLLVLIHDERDGVSVDLMGAGDLEVVAHSTNLAGEPRDDLAFGPVAKTYPADALLPSLLKERIALLKTAQLVGAMQRCCELAVDYAHQREQFGRRLAQFQAVQHDIVRMVEETSLANVLLGAAASAWGPKAHGDDHRITAVAAAAVAASRASVVVGAIAHQIHGAIGLTAEYPLHQFSRRLHAWRRELLTLDDWGLRLGAHIVTGATHHDSLLDLLTLTCSAATELNRDSER